MHVYARMRIVAVMGISVGVVGASGYSGGELLRLLAGHPEFRLAALFAHRAAGTTVAHSHPNLLSLADLPIEVFSPEASSGLDLVFLCLPAGESARIVPDLGDATAVVDLSGDHRLPPAEYERWYRKPADRNEGWVYGLTELVRERLRGARRIANPGCYPTPAVLALAPLLRSGIAAPHDVVVDALSGVSGAGAQETLAYSFTELAEDASPYKIGAHQHTPEIEHALRELAGSDVVVTFTPHLVPMARGIVATCSAPLAGVGDPAEAARELYRRSPFVRVVDAPPHAKAVRGSNAVLLHYTRVERSGRVVAVGVIDNMVKGAAGQAIQNANVALDLDEAAGLPLDGTWL